MRRPDVNQRLTGNRRRRVVENDEFGDFARRVIRAYGRRIAAGDVEALRQLLALAADVDQAADEAVEGLREHGYSWGEIADRLDMSRQAAHKRWAEVTGR